MKPKVPLTFLFLFSILLFIFVNPAAPQVPRTTIFIQPDGSLNPSNIPIQRNGDTYTFTGNVYDPIYVLKSNVTLDGAGYSLIGPLSEEQKETVNVLGLGPNTTVEVQYVIGIDFDKAVSGVTIRNVNIDAFYIGIYIRTTNNTLVDNAVNDNIVGVLLSGSTNNITKNYISNNKQGLFFGFEQINGSAANIPSDIRISDNSFINNTMQLSGCVCKIYNFTEARHAWDYNNRGNYWSDYNGTDSNHDGIGDTYYNIDPLNYDRYPLIESPIQPPTPTYQFPLALTIIVIVVVILVIGIIGVVQRTRKRT